MTFTLKDAIRAIQTNRDLMKMDFKDKQYGEKAKLLVKHYDQILSLLRGVK